MILFFHRPNRLRLSPEAKKSARSKCRRPLDKRGNIKFIKTEKKEDSDSDDAKSKCDDDKLDEDGEKKPQSPEKDKSKLDKILKKLADRMTSTLAINGNGTNGHHPSQTPTTYSLASHIANSINTQPHQHVSPRKRILRELEKVSLEDTKRSRPKTQNHATGTMNGNTIPTASISPQISNGSLKHQPDKAPTAPPASRPISSYSITSLLAHNNNSTTASGAPGCNSINEHSNDSSSASHYHHRDGAQQRLSLSQNSPPKSPSMMQHKRKSPNTTPPGNNGNTYHSPNQSPSPEHHAFQKYRPTTTPTAAQASSPYSGSYHSPNYMRGSPSPHGDGYNNNRLRTTGSYQHSPSHYVSSPSQHSYATPRDSSLSPNVERTSLSSRSTPTSSGSTGIRTVPKKTAALRQQFSSPTMESSNKKPVMKNEKPMDVDALLRPSALVPPPVPHPSQMYPYMYPMSYMPTAVPPYYHPAFYNPAMMAAAAASYRIPGLHPGAIPGYPGAMSPVSASHMAGSSPPVSNFDKNSNGQRNSTISSPPATHPSLSPYVPTSPWNPIPLTNHSINDGNLIAKGKDEPSSGAFDRETMN